MLVNPTIYAVFAALAALCVFVDASKRRRQEASSAGNETDKTGGIDEEDWDFVTPDPLRWSLFALVVPVVGLPLYFARSKSRMGLAAGAIGVGIGCAATLLVLPHFDVLAPFTPTKPIPWSRMPPGLPKAIRAATEQLPTDLATRVIDLLPGLVAVGKSYPGGAGINVTPGEHEAQVLLTIHNDPFIEMAALRLFETPKLAQKEFTRSSDEPGKTPRAVTIAGEIGVQFGPERAAGAAKPVFYVQLLVHRQDVVADIFLQEGQAANETLTPERQEALEKEILKIAEKVLGAVPPLAH